MNLHKLLAAAASLCMITSNAQNGIPISDQQPANINGLEMGYRIKSEETKQVSDKGDFSRYSISFYVRNSSPEEKIIFYRPGWNGSVIASDQLAQFNCLNATGARLTSKSVTLSAKPCMIMAQTSEKDCASGKMVDVKKMVQVGYSIKPGEVIEASAIVIVPLNDKPNMQAVLVASQLAGGGSMNAGNNGGPGTMDAPVRFKHVLTSTYLNNQNNMLGNGPAQNDWSSQFQLVPTTVNGNDYVTIKSRSGNGFLSADQGRLVLFPDNSANNTLWLLVPTNEPDIVRIKNGKSGACIIVTGGQLGLSVGNTGDPNSYWVVQR